MARYTNGVETVDTIAWDGDFSHVTSFLQSNPPVLNPKVLEDNPNAIGVIEQPLGTLTVFTDAGYEFAQLTDMLIRGGDHKLRTSTAAVFNQTFTLVQ
jgi:hypothetical protein